MGGWLGRVAGDSVSFLLSLSLFLTIVPVMLFPRSAPARGCPARKWQGKLKPLPQRLRVSGIIVFLFKEKKMVFGRER